MTTVQQDLEHLARSHAAHYRRAWAAAAELRAALRPLPGLRAEEDALRGSSAAASGHVRVPRALPDPQVAMLESLLLQLERILNDPVQYQG
jgi:hypothetical protein